MGAPWAGVELAGIMYAISERVQITAQGSETNLAETGGYRSPVATACSRALIGCVPIRSGQVCRLSIRLIHAGAMVIPTISRPVTAVERAVLDGLGDVCRADGVGAVEVGDCERHFEDAVMGAGAQPQAVDGAFEQALAID